MKNEASFCYKKNTFNFQKALYMENFCEPGGNTLDRPTCKLGHFESAAEIFLVYIASISLARGSILSITSLYAKVLRALKPKL